MPDPNTTLGTTLHGLRVLDLTRNLAGPYCTMILGDLGADVIKIERPQTGDDTRGWSPPSWDGVSTVFLSANRNKRGVTIDLNCETGLEIVRAMARQVDIVVESFRPGSLTRRGLDYESVKAANPTVIYCSLSAFGSTGPLKNEPGYDPVLQATTGMMAMTGEPGQSAVRIPVSLIDMGAAMWAAMGILAALRNRDATGKGALVETSLFEASIWWLNYHILGYFGTGRIPERWGSGTAMIAPYEVFPTADEGLLVGAANDNLFRRFTTVLGIPEMGTDPAYASNHARVEHREAMLAVIRPIMLTHTTAEWEAIFQAEGIPHSRVLTIAELVETEQFAEAGMLQPSPHPDVPGLQLIDLPVTHNHSRTTRPTPPPRLGEHNAEVLGEFGYSEAEQEALRTAGAFG